MENVTGKSTNIRFMKSRHLFNVTNYQSGITREMNPFIKCHQIYCTSRTHKHTVLEKANRNLTSRPNGYFLYSLGLGRAQTLISRAWIHAWILLSLSCLPYLATFSNERLEAQKLCCALTVRVRQYGPQEICNNIVIKLHSQNPEIVNKNRPR